MSSKARPAVLFGLNLLNQQDANAISFMHKDSPSESCCGGDSDGGVSAAGVNESAPAEWALDPAVYLSPIGEKNKEYHAFLKDDYVVPDWSAGVIPKTVIRTAFFDSALNVTEQEFRDYWEWKDPSLTEAWNKTNELNPDYTTRWFNWDTAAAYVEKYFKKEAKWAFHAIKPGAIKSDLFRLMVLYKEGGVYLDAKLMPLKPFGKIFEAAWNGTKDFRSEPDQLAMPTAADVGYLAACQNFDFAYPGNMWGLMNAFMAAKPQNPVVGDMIYDVVKRVQAGFYGFSSWEPSGPVGMYVSMLRSTKNDAELGQVLDAKQWSEQAADNRPTKCPTLQGGPGKVTFIIYDGAWNWWPSEATTNHGWSPDSASCGGSCGPGASGDAEEDENALVRKNYRNFEGGGGWDNTGDTPAGLVTLKGTNYQKMWEEHTFYAINCYNQIPGLPLPGAYPESGRCRTTTTTTTTTATTMGGATTTTTTTAAP